MIADPLSPSDRGHLLSRGFGDPDSPASRKFLNELRNHNQASRGLGVSPSSSPPTYSTTAKPSGMGNQGENSDSDKEGGIQEEEGEEEEVVVVAEGDRESVGGGGGDQKGVEEGGEIGGAQRHRTADHETGDNRSKFTCEPGSSENTEFVERNLKELQEKCKQFSECTNELYSASNYHLILAGKHTRLANICGLIYANGGGQYKTLNEQCSLVEREAIRVSIGRQLKEQLAGGSLDQTWQELKNCTEERKRENETTIDTVCRLKLKAGENPDLCGSTSVNTETRTFFNHELETLHCNCVAINSSAGKAKGFQNRWIGYTIAGSFVCLLFVLTIAVIVLCLRHRKMARKLDRHKVRYEPSSVRDVEDSSATIYQEIHDVPRAPNPPSRPHPADRKLLPQGYQLDLAPPAPERYVRGLNLPRGPYRTSPDDHGDDRPHSYLDPLPDPVLDLDGQGRARLGVRTPDSAGMTRGRNPYSLARTVAEREPAVSPYCLAKPMGESSHDDAARRVDEAASRSAGKGYEPGTAAGTYFDSIKLARGRSEDELGYSKLRVPPGCDAATITTFTTTTTTTTPLSATGDPLYFELEAEAEEGRADGDDGVLSTSTRL